MFRHQMRRLDVPAMVAFLAYPDAERYQEKRPPLKRAIRKAVEQEGADGPDSRLFGHRQWSIVDDGRAARRGRKNIVTCEKSRGHCAEHRRSIFLRR